MKRYSFCAAAVPAYEYCEAPDGEWVRFEDAHAEIRELQAQVDCSVGPYELQIAHLKAQLAQERLDYRKLLADSVGMDLEEYAARYGPMPVYPDTEVNS